MKIDNHQLTDDNGNAVPFKNSPNQGGQVDRFDRMDPKERWPRTFEKALADLANARRAPKPPGS